jgi:hypothetical protein
VYEQLGLMSLLALMPPGTISGLFPLAGPNLGARKLCTPGSSGGLDVLVRNGTRDDIVQELQIFLVGDSVCLARVSAKGGRAEPERKQKGNKQRT